MITSAGSLSRVAEYSTEEYSLIFGLDSPRPTPLSSGPSLVSGRKWSSPSTLGVSAIQFNSIQSHADAEAIERN